MAKSTGFFTLRRGSTKSLTFQIYRGKQVTKDRVSQVSNPQTALQTAQRLVFATVASATKFMAPIIDHSFEGKSFGGVSKNYFNKLNVRHLRDLAAVDFAEAPSAADASVFMTTKGVSALIPNQYIISDGSLSASKLKVKRNAGQAGSNPDGILSIDAIEPVAIPVTTLASGEKVITYGDLLQKVFGLTANDEQLTLCVVQRSGEGYRYAFQGEADYPGWAIAYTSFNARRLCVDDSLDLSTQIVLSNASGVPLESAEDAIVDSIVRLFAGEKTDQTFRSVLESVINANVSGTGDTFAVSVGVDEIAISNITADEDGNGTPYAAGIIRSKRNGGNWLRSRCVMLISVPTSTYNFGLDWNSAQQAWFEQPVVAEDGEFLDEGGADGAVGESF